MVGDDGRVPFLPLDDLHVDKLFLGVDGFDVERGITTHFEPEAMLNRKMVAAAARVIAVTDASKFGRTCLHRIINVGEINIKSKTSPEPNRTIVAELVATTFVLQDGAVATKGGAVPKQPSVNK